TLREAERLLASDPTRAVQQLQSALVQVEDDTVLSEQRRETLRRVLKDRIRVATSLAQDAARLSTEQGERQARVAARRLDAEPVRTTQDSMQQLRQGIQKWQKEAANPAAAN